MMKEVCILALITAMCLCSDVDPGMEIEEGGDDCIIVHSYVPGDGQGNMDNMLSLTSEQYGWFQEGWDYRQFLVRLQTSRENELRNMGKRAEEGQFIYVDLLLNKWKAEGEGLHHALDEICRQLRLVLCKVLGLRECASELVVKLASYRVENFIPSDNLIEDKEIQMALETIRSIRRELGWSINDLRVLGLKI
jgi:hypothetical protein